MMHAMQTNDKPVLLALRPPQDLAGMEEFLIAQKAFVAAGLPVFYSLQGLARAMKRIVAGSNSEIASGKLFSQAFI